jgi:hypothetical protein
VGSSNTSKPPSKTEPESGGPVIGGALYRLDEVKARMGWRDAAFRAAVRAGLKTHRSGKRLYVLGSDLIDFVTKREAGR